MTRVLLIVGTPGVGKSSVSALLASRLNGVHINLSSLVVDENLSCGFDKKREVPIADTERISHRVNEIIRESESYAIIEGHFAMDIVPKKDLFLIFILRRNPDELQEILRKRGYKKGKVLENIVAEILDVCLFDSVKTFGEEKVCEINTSNRTAEDIVKEIIDVINGNTKCRIGIVDWLTRLEFEGRLEKYLASF